LPATTITIKENLWRDLVKAAREDRRRPEQLTEEVLRDFLRRRADEELLARSARIARRSGFRAADTENVIRRFRQRKRKP
jgi:hypothetical protein